LPVDRHADAVEERGEDDDHLRVVLLEPEVAHQARLDAVLRELARSLSAMLVTIWTCTQEWSLIAIRETALTFETCHQPLSWSSALTRSSSVRSLRLPRTGR
jgi:hypothetical protein